MAFHAPCFVASIANPAEASWMDKNRSPVKVSRMFLNPCLWRCEALNLEKLTPISERDCDHHNDSFFTSSFVRGAIAVTLGLNSFHARPPCSKRSIPVWPRVKVG